MPATVPKVGDQPKCPDWSALHSPQIKAPRLGRLRQERLAPLLELPVACAPCPRPSLCPPLPHACSSGVSLSVCRFAASCGHQSLDLGLGYPSCSMGPLWAHCLHMRSWPQVGGMESRGPYSTQDSSSRCRGLLGPLLCLHPGRVAAQGPEAEVPWDSECVCTSPASNLCSLPHSLDLSLVKSTPTSGLAQEAITLEPTQAEVALDSLPENLPVKATSVQP